MKDKALVSVDVYRPGAVVPPAVDVGWAHDQSEAEAVARRAGFIPEKTRYVPWWNHGAGGWSVWGRKENRR